MFDTWNQTCTEIGRDKDMSETIDQVNRKRDGWNESGKDRLRNVGIVICR